MRKVIVAAAVVTSMVAFAHAQVVVVPPPPFYAPGYMVYAPGFQPVPYGGGFYVQSLHPAPIVNPYFADTPFYRSYYPAPIVNPYLRPPACRAFTIHVPRQPGQQEAPSPRYPRTSHVRLEIVE